MSRHTRCAIHGWYSTQEECPSCLDARSRLPVAQPECEDCRDAKRHAYSDATTPGFFHDTCEKHRKPPTAASKILPTGDGIVKPCPHAQRCVHPCDADECFLETIEHPNGPDKPLTKEECDAMEQAGDETVLNKSKLKFPCRMCDNGKRSEPHSPCPICGSTEDYEPNVNNSIPTVLDGAKGVEVELPPLAHYSAEDRTEADTWLGGLSPKNTGIFAHAAFCEKLQRERQLRAEIAAHNETKQQLKIALQTKSKAVERNAELMRLLEGYRSSHVDCRHKAVFRCFLCQQFDAIKEPK